jgi:hypothetical protein
MEIRAGQCKTTKRLAVIQNYEQGWTGPVAHPVSTVTKITAVCAMVIFTTSKLVNSGFSVLGTVEDGSTKFAWKMGQI